MSQDLKRTEELGKNVSPGSANCRLIGSKWCYIQRPVDGDTIYTDYYGRYDVQAKQRGWTLDANQTGSKLHTSTHVH